MFEFLADPPVLAWWQAVLGAAASLGGGLLKNEGAKDSASSQNAFQDRLSRTAYQRATADMKAAGLNPMLAYQQGGASTPSGAGYTLDNIGEAAVNSARQASVATAEIDEIEARTDTQKTLSSLQEAQEKLANTQNVASAAQAKRDLASERLLNEQTIKTGFEALAARESVATAKAEAGLRLLELQGSSRFGTSTTGRQLEGLERAVKRGGSTIRELFESFPDWYRNLTKGNRK